jgi:antirestriction protein
MAARLARRQPMVQNNMEIIASGYCILWNSLYIKSVAKVAIGKGFRTMNATNQASKPAPAEYRIYVACLASYNAGKLYGKWIDCDGKSADDLQHEVNVLLWNSPEPNVPASYCRDCQHVEHYSSGPNCEECNSGNTEVGNSAEEYAIHDHEGFGDLIGEHTPLDKVAAIVDALESADEPAALIAYAEHGGYGDITDAADTFADAYCGEWDSELAFAENFMDGCYEIPDYLVGYIDYDAFRRDLFCGDYWSENTASGVYVFRSL